MRSSLKNEQAVRQISLQVARRSGRGRNVLEIKSTRIARIACNWLNYGYVVKVACDNGEVFKARCEEDIYSHVGRADYIGFEV